MADKTTGELPAVKVGDLPLAPDVYDDSLIPVEMQGSAMHITGAQWKRYAVAAVKDYSDSANRSASAAQGSAERAETAMESIHKALSNLPAGDTLVINDLTTGGTSAALSAEMGKVLGRRPSPNLLDNAYLANPVNQRGLTEYTAAGYTFDRWKMGSTSGKGVGTVSIRRNEYVSVDCTEKDIRLTQTLDDATIVGKKAVLSILAADGLHSNTLTIGAVYGGVNADIATLFSTMSGNLPTVILDFKVGAVYNIIAVKLELGSTQTLAHLEGSNWVLNEIPDYGEELLKCQRYYYQTWTGTLSLANGPTITGFPLTETRMPMVRFPVEMASNPRVKIFGAMSGTEGCISDWISDEDLVTNASAVYVTPKGFIPASQTGGLELNRSYQFHYSASADL